MKLKEKTKLLYIALLDDNFEINKPHQAVGNRMIKITKTHKDYEADSWYMPEDAREYLKRRL